MQLPKVLFVKIDRILANKKISMVLLIEGTRILDKSTMPSIRSEDTDGKTYLSKDSVPPSAGSFILGGAILLHFSVIWSSVSKQKTTLSWAP